MRQIIFNSSLYQYIILKFSIKSIHIQYTIYNITNVCKSIQLCFDIVFYYTANIVSVLVECVCYLKIIMHCNLNGRISCMFINISLTYISLRKLIQKGRHIPHLMAKISYNSVVYEASILLRDELYVKSLMLICFHDRHWMRTNFLFLVFWTVNQKLKKP